MATVFPLALRDETAYNTLDGAALDWQFIDINSGGIRQGIIRVDSPRLRADRKPVAAVVIGNRPSCNFATTMSLTTFDKIMESLAGATWAGDTLAIGGTRKSLSAVQEFTGYSRWHYATGLLVNTFSLTIPFDNLVTATCEMMGAGYDKVDVDPISASIVAASATRELNGRKDMAQFEIGGSGSGLYAQSVTLNWSNQVIVKEASGNENPFDVELGNVAITGSVTMHVTQQAIDLSDLIRSNTAVSLAVGMSDGTNTLDIDIPAMKLIGDLPEAPQANSPALMTLDLTVEGDVNITRGTV